LVLLTVVTSFVSIAARGSSAVSSGRRYWTLYSQWLVKQRD